MSRARVIITGRGALSSGGVGCTAFVGTVLSGIATVTPVTDRRVAYFGPCFAGQIPNLFVNSPYGPEDRCLTLARTAAEEAIGSAAIDLSLPGARAGLFVGTCSGPMQTIERTYELRSRGGGGVRLDAAALGELHYHSIANTLACFLGVGGPVATITTACSAFSAALATAADLIRIGLLDVALVGGADALSLTTLAGFVGLKAVSAEACAPFSLPTGLNLGEGAGFLVLESGEYATNRGAPFLGEVLGYALTNDAYHCSAPDPTGRGAAATMALALLDAGCNVQSIGYSNAHGTGTEANDRAETKAIRRVFGADTTLPVSSQKSIFGHCLGAASALETVATLLCAARKVLPVTANFSEPREGCSLDYVAVPGRPWPELPWIKNSFAFGGNNASVVFSSGKETLRSLPEAAVVPIVITAIGLVTSAGVDLASLGECSSGEGMQPIERPTLNHGLWPVLPALPFALSDIDRRIPVRGLSRSEYLSIAATALALKRGAIVDQVKIRSTIGLFMNLAHGSLWAEQVHLSSLLDHDFALNQIHAFPYIVPNSITGTVCRVLSLRGYNNTFCNGVDAGLPGLAYAFAAVKAGHTGALLCGAVDSFADEGLFDMVAAENRPDKPLLGEGAVTMLLEPANRAAERGAVPLATILDCAFFRTRGDNTPAQSTAQQLMQVVTQLMERNSVDVTAVGTLLFRADEPLLQEVVRACPFPKNRVVSYPSEGMAWLPASSPLIAIAAALFRNPVEKSGSANYIFSITHSPAGNSTILLLKNHYSRKSDAPP